MTRAVRPADFGARALVNAREEAYCRLRSENKSQAQAWKEAGFPVSIDAHGEQADNASRLERRPIIRARIAYLNQEATDFLALRRIHVINRLDRVGRANLADYLEAVVDHRGNVELKLRDITKLPRELTEAIAGIEYDGDGRPKLKLWNKNEANIALLKYFGDIPDDDDRPDRGTTVNIFNALSAEDQLALAAVLEALPAGEEDAGGQAAGEREPGATEPQAL